MVHILLRMKFEFEPIRRCLAEVRLWIGAKTRLNLPRKAEVEQVVGVKMGELATENRPCWIAMRSKARGGLLDVGQLRQHVAQLFSWAHRELASSEYLLPANRRRDTAARDVRAKRWVGRHIAAERRLASRTTTHVESRTLRNMDNAGPERIDEGPPAIGETVTFNVDQQ